MQDKLPINIHASGTVAQILLGANITPTSAEVMITSEVADIIKARQIAKMTTFLRIKLLVGIKQILLFELIPFLLADWFPKDHDKRSTQ